MLVREYRRDADVESQPARINRAVGENYNRLGRQPGKVLGKRKRGEGAEITRRRRCEREVEREGRDRCHRGQRIFKRRSLLRIRGGSAGAIADTGSAKRPFKTSLFAFYREDTHVWYSPTLTVESLASRESSSMHRRRIIQVPNAEERRGDQHSRTLTRATSHAWSVRANRYFAKCKFEQRSRARRHFSKRRKRGECDARARKILVDSVNRIQRRPAATSLRHRLRPTPATLSRISRISVTTPLHFASPPRHFALPTTSLFRHYYFGCVPFGDATFVGLLRPCRPWRCSTKVKQKQIMLANVAIAKWDVTFVSSSFWHSLSFSYVLACLCTLCYIF